MWLWASVYAWLQVSLGLGVLVILLPAAVVPARPGERPLDRFWRLLLVGLLFWICAGYLLGALHDFEFLTLAALGAVCLVLGRRLLWRPEPLRDGEGAEVPPPDRVPLAGLALEAMDPGFLQGRLRAAWGRLRQHGGGVAGALGRLRDPASAAGVLAIAAAFGLRLAGPLLQAGPGTSDTYVHLLWTNRLLQGQLFPQGVYPEGMHAVAAAIADVFFLDPLTVLRFLGPTAGALLVLAVYTLALEISGNRLAAAVAAAVFGLGTASPLPESAWRQIAPLPQEMGAIFVPLGLAYALRCLRGGGRGALGLLAGAFAAASLIHPYGSAFGGLVVACLALGAVLMPGDRGRPALLTVAAAAAGGLGGLLPLLAGRLAGVALYASSAQFVAHGNAGATPGLWGLVQGNPYLEIGLMLSGALIVLAFRPETRTAAGWLYLGFGLAIGALYGLMAAASTGAAYVPEIARTSEFLSIVLVPVACGVFFGGRLGQHEHRRAALAVAAVLVLPALALWPPRLPWPQRLEPEGATHSYLRIRTDFTVRQWTIVSPVQQYSEAADRGWHVELDDFVHRFSLGEAADPRFLLENAGTGSIATPDVFLFVETTPLGTQGALQAADLLLPLPDGSGPQVYDGAFRRAIEARAYEWGVTYMRAHPGDAGIYYHSPTFVVFHIRQG